MIQSGAKSLQNSGGVGGAAAPPMMIEQLGAKNLKSSGRMMIEKVMIQIGAKSPKNSGSPPTMIKSDDSIRAKKICFKKKSSGGVISSSAARPNGTSEGSITGKLIPVKHLKRSGGGGAAIPPMMIEKVMIQLKARGGWGGRQPPHEKVMIQLGPKKKKAAGGSSVPLRQGLMVQVRIQSRAN